MFFGSLKVSFTGQTKSFLTMGQLSGGQKTVSGPQDAWIVRPLKIGISIGLLAWTCSSLAFFCWYLGEFSRLAICLVSLGVIFPMSKMSELWCSIAQFWWSVPFFRWSPSAWFLPSSVWSPTPQKPEVSRRRWAIWIIIFIQYNTNIQKSISLISSLLTIYIYISSNIQILSWSISHASQFLLFSW